MTRAYLALGSNLEDREALLQGALDGLRSTPGVTVVAVSAVYDTGPVGGPAQDRYLNAVVGVDTTLEPLDLLRAGFALEAAARRVRVERWGPRTLDVDVLLYGDEHLDTPELQVPHPRMWERTFVTIPLHDVAPDLVGERPDDADVVRSEFVLR
jgi:2-amino-4-hydroxy-6-hydroxymethyldihydropteridine diphosphokinase